MGAWTGLSWLRTGTGGGNFKGVNLWVPKNAGNFLTK